MTSVFQSLENISPYNSLKKPNVNLPNGMTTPITHTGEISLSSRVELKKVLFVPNFHYNLLSVSKFYKDNTVTVIFFSSFLPISGPIDWVYDSDW